MAAISLLSMRFTHRQTFINCYLGSWRRWKTTVDFSLVPKIQEVDLEEKFVRGSGPGGSAVNKNSNCVVLTHTPTGIVIKCHISRSLDENRKLARQLLISKLDEVYNQDKSIITQKKNIEKEKNLKSNRKRTKLETLKLTWKDREGIE